MRAYFVEDIKKKDITESAAQNPVKDCEGAEFKKAVKYCTGYKHDAYMMADGKPGKFFTDKDNKIFVTSRMLTVGPKILPAVQVHGFGELLATKYFGEDDNDRARDMVKSLSLNDFFSTDIEDVLKSNGFRIYKWSTFEHKIQMWNDLNSSKDSLNSEKDLQEVPEAMKAPASPEVLSTSEKSYKKVLKDFGIVGVEDVLMDDGKPGKYAVVMDGKLLVTTGDSDPRVHIFGKVRGKTPYYLAMSKKKKVEPDESRKLVATVASSVLQPETLEAVLKTLKFTIFDKEMEKFLKKVSSMKKETVTMTESIAAVSGEDIIKKFPFLPIVHNGHLLLDGSESEAAMNKAHNLVALTWADIKSTSNLARQDIIFIFGYDKENRAWSVIGKKEYKRSDAAKKAIKEIFRIIDTPEKVFELAQKRGFKYVDTAEWKWQEIIAASK